MATLIRDNVPDLMDLNIAAQDYFVDAYAKYPMPFLQYFDVHGSTKKSETVSEQSGVSAPGVLGENDDFPQVSPIEGYDTTLTNLEYAQSLPLSRNLLRDDPKGIYTTLQRQVNSHVKAMNQRASLLAAAIITGSMTVAGPDGQYLVDTDHPTSPSNATTLSNKINTKLDPAGIALQEMITKIATNGKDMAGNQILFGRWILVVPPALHGNALKSCVALYGEPFSLASLGVFSELMAGRAVATPVQTGAIFNQKPFMGTTIEVVQDPFIGSGYSGGSDVKWYLISAPDEANGYHSLRWQWREEPKVIDVWERKENKAMNVDGLMSCAAGAIGWRNIWGSDGTV